MSSRVCGRALIALPAGGFSTHDKRLFPSGWLHQGYGTGHPAGFLALPNEPERRSALEDFHVDRRQAQGFRDTEASLEHHPDQERVALTGSWTIESRVLELPYFVWCEVGYYCNSPSDSHLPGND